MTREPSIDIRYCLTRHLGEPAIAGVLETLSPPERARHERYTFARDRRDFAVAHGMLRSVLSTHHPIEPSAWTFVVGRHGKPTLPHDLPGCPGLAFNLAHADGLVACAVTSTGEVGIDVERISLRGADPLTLAARFFSPAEQLDLERCDVAERTTRFIEIWTLKEAYIKALGLGLSATLRDFSLIPGEGRIRFDPGAGGNPQGWRFALFEPADGYRMAVAVRGSTPSAHWLSARAFVIGQGGSSDVRAPLRAQTI
jgi:4'-phosphopantetheinyl transferase